MSAFISISRKSYPFVLVDQRDQWGYLHYDTKLDTFTLKFFACHLIDTEPERHIYLDTQFDRDYTWRVALCSAKDGGKDFLVFFDSIKSHFTNGLDPRHEFRLFEGPTHDIKDLVTAKEAMHNEDIDLPYFLHYIVFLSQWPV